MKKNSYMQFAINEAQKGIGANHGGPFGAVVVLNNTIIGRGYNRVLVDHDATQHGEMVAIRDAYKNMNLSLSEDAIYRPLNGAVMYTTCYPCPMCLGACLWSGISKVYYGCTSQDAAKIGFDDAIFYEYFQLGDKITQFLLQDKEHYESCKKLFDAYCGSLY